MWAMHTKIYTKILIVEEKFKLAYLKCCELCVVAYAWNPRVEGFQLPDPVSQQTNNQGNDGLV